MILLPLLLVSVASSQTFGSLDGRVRESWGRGVGIGGALIEVQGRPVRTHSDYKGRYTLEGLHAGVYTITVTMPGYQSAEQHRVPVYAGIETVQNFFLAADTMATAPPPEPLVDAHARAKHQHLTIDELSALPVNTVDEVVRLWTPVNSLRGGRAGAHLLTIDGIPVTNGYDASTRAVGLRVPVDLLSDVAVAFDPWAAELPLSTAGAIGLSLREPGDAGPSFARYATDRPAQGSADLWYDRIAGRGTGSIGRTTMMAGIEARGRMAAEEIGTPWTTPRHRTETLDGAAKITIPVGTSKMFRVVGVYSRERAELFDPAYQFSNPPGDAETVDAAFVSGQFQHHRGKAVFTTQLSYFNQSMLEGALAAAPDPRFGALGGRYDVVGADIARARDTAAAQSAVAGYSAPTLDVLPEWGVAAFFKEGARGTLRWNRYREIRVGASYLHASGVRSISLAFEGNAAQALGFERALAFLPAGGTVPPPTANDPRALTISFKGRYQTGREKLRLTLGLQVDAHRLEAAASTTTRIQPSPYLNIVVPINGVSVFGTVAYEGHFPDLQFAGDLALGDSVAGGQFRLGHDTLEYETVLWQEFGAAARFGPADRVRVTVFHRQYANLVSSVGSPTPQFANGDESSLIGVEISADKGLGGTRLSGTASIGHISAGSRNGLYQATPNEGPVQLLTIMARTTLPFALQTSLIGRYQSGVPYAFAPIEHQNPGLALDALMRHSFKIGGRTLTGYFEAKNWLRTGGDVDPAEADVDNAALAAYAQGPQSIPYDSPRYRASADLDHNGRVEGTTELFPLYQQAASNYLKGLRSFLPPSTFRLGASVEF